jgi:hypothetical protein
MPAADGSDCILCDFGDAKPSPNGQQPLRERGEQTEHDLSVLRGRRELVCRRGSWCDKAQLAQEALTYSNWNIRITMEIFPLKSSEEIGPLLALQDHNTEKISALGKQLREQIESEKERELLDAVDSTRWPYIDSYKQPCTCSLTSRSLPRQGRL